MNEPKNDGLESSAGGQLIFAQLPRRWYELPNHFAESSATVSSYLSWFFGVFVNQPNSWCRVWVLSNGTGTLASVLSGSKIRLTRWHIGADTHKPQNRGSWVLDNGELQFALTHCIDLNEPKNEITESSAGGQLMFAHTLWWWYELALRFCLLSPWQRPALIWARG